MPTLCKPLIALCLLSLTAQAQAVQCDRSITGVSTDDGYKPRPRAGPTHCEGLYVSPVGGPALELVSLTYGKPFDRQRAPTTLTLSAPERSASNETLHLRATGIPTGLYYRLDADLPPSGTFEWPAGAILTPRHIRLDQVGLFAFSSNISGEPTYTPVRIEGEADGSTATSRSVFAVVRPLLPLDRAYWRFVPHDAKAGAWTPQDASGDRVVIALTVPSDVAGGSLQLAWDDPETGTRKVKYFAIAF